MSNQLTTGIKISVDTSDLDVKFLKSVDELNAGLTKTQKALHLTYNENGLLTNAFGQCVEGLSTSQIKLGEYVDELGRVRTIQGGFTEGLNKSQIAMGQYADELGRIYNKTGELIGQTAQATKRLEQQAKETEAANAKLSSAQESFSGTAKTANDAAKSIGELSEALLGSGNAISGVINFTTSLGTSILELGENFEKLQKSKDTLEDLPKQFQNIGKYGKALKDVFNAIGSKTLWAEGALAAFAVALQGLKIHSEYLRDVAPEFEEIARSAWRAHERIKNLGDALNFGALAEDQKTRLGAALEELDRLNKSHLTQQEQDEVDVYKARKSAFGDFCAWYSETTSKYFDHPLELFGIDHTRHEKEKAMAEINEEIAAIEEGRKTEEDRLNERIKDLQDLLNQESLTDKQRDDIQGEITSALETNLGVSINPIETAAEEVQKKLKTFADAYEKGGYDKQQRADVEKQLTDKYLEAIKKDGLTKEEIAEAEAEYKKAFEESRLSEAGYKDAMDALTKAATDEARGKLAGELGINFDEINAKIKEKTDELENTEPPLDEFEALEKALQDHTVSEEESAEILKELQKRYAENLNSETQEALNESLGNVKDAYENIEKALNEGRITQEQYNETVKDANATARSKAESEMGVRFDTSTDADKYKDNAAVLKTMFEKKTITEDEYNNALGQLKDHAIEAIPGLKGILEKQKEEATAQDRLNEARAAITKALEDGVFSEEEANEARKRAKEAYENEVKARKDQNAKDLGAEELAKAAQQFEKQLTPAQKAEQQYEALKNAFKKGEITQEAMNEATRNWHKARDGYAKAEKKAQLEQAQKQKDNMRSKLGVDSLMESLKTPLEKYRETMDEVDRAARSGAITNQERLALEEKAASDYWETMNQAGETAEKAGAAVGKLEVAQSIGRGSAALYTSQIPNATANYQNRIQSTTADMLKTNQDMLIYMQQSADYLSNMQTMNVWG